VSRAVYTHRGALVINEPCGCRHDGRSYVSPYKADEGKLGMCAPHQAEHDALHAAAVLAHRTTLKERLP